MALLEATLTQRYFDQTVVNRFNYKGTGTPAAVTFSFGLVSALGAIYEGAPTNAYPTTGLLAAMRALQAEEVQFVSLVVRAIYSVTDFYEQPFVVPMNGEVSTASGGALSPVVAWGFRTNRTRTDIRPGQKRFVGVAATAMTDGGVVSQPWVDGQMSDLATAMGATLTYDDEGNTLTYAPVIVSKRPPGSYADDPDQKGYAYYPTEAEQDQHIMDSIIWSPKPQLRTQVTRQYGRGV
jgi:hypothetical protein